MSPTTAITWPPVHLSLCLPPADPDALAPLTLALGLQARLRTLGCEATLGRRDLRPQALNLVLGVAHGWDADAARDHVCVLVHEGAAAPVTPQARRLLARWPVLQLDDSLLPEPADAAHEPPRWRVWPGAGLPVPASPPEPPVLPYAALRWLGPATPRQAALLAGLAHLGVPLDRQDPPLHGPECLQAWQQSGCVLQLLVDDAAAPDPVRLALALSQGAAVLAERPAAGTPLPEWPPAAAVHWFTPEVGALQAVLQGGVGSAALTAAHDRARQRWRQAAQDQAPHDAAEWARLAAWATAALRRPARPLAPPPHARRLHWLQPGDLCGPRHGWARWSVGEPPPAEAAWDLVDLGAPPVSDPALLALAWRQLAPGGRLVWRWRGPQADDWRQGLAPWADRFWLQAGLAERLEVVHAAPLDAEGRLLSDDAPVAHCWRVVACRRPTTAAERTRARAAGAALAG